MPEPTRIHGRPLIDLLRSRDRYLDKMSNKETVIGSKEVELGSRSGKQEKAIKSTETRQKPTN